MAEAVRKAEEMMAENAQRNMEQILTAQDNQVDAVVASNDGTAGGCMSDESTAAKALPAAGWIATS